MVKIENNIGNDLLLVIISLILFLFIVRYLEYLLTNVFVPHRERQSSIYQGGELIESKERRYRAKNFDFTLYFLILHVMGFFAATLFILGRYGYQPITWITVTFGGVLFYTILLIRKMETK